LIYLFICMFMEIVLLMSWFYYYIRQMQQFYTSAIRIMFLKRFTYIMDFKIKSYLCNCYETEHDILFCIFSRHMKVMFALLFIKYCMFAYFSNIIMLWWRRSWLIKFSADLKQNKVHANPITVKVKLKTMIGCNYVSTWNIRDQTITCGRTWIVVCGSFIYSSIHIVHSLFHLVVILYFRYISTMHSLRIKI
jgi:hypothetical protein